MGYIYEEEIYTGIFTERRYVQRKSRYEERTYVEKRRLTQCRTYTVKEHRERWELHEKEIYKEGTYTAFTGGEHIRRGNIHGRKIYTEGQHRRRRNIRGRGTYLEGDHIQGGTYTEGEYTREETYMEKKLI